MNLEDREHIAYIKGLYKEHKGGAAKKFEHFYQAQTLWDEGVAETISRHIHYSCTTEETIIVIAGSGHIAFEFGIPKRFYPWTPLPYRTLVLKTWKKDLYKELFPPGVSRPLANYLWIIHPGALSSPDLYI